MRSILLAFGSYKKGTELLWVKRFSESTVREDKGLEEVFFLHEKVFCGSTEGG